MTDLKNEHGNRLVGYIELGGLAVPRADLAKVLPDIERFENCLADALMVDKMMDDGGGVPDCLQLWTDDHLADVQATMGEIAAIHTEAANNARAELTMRHELRGR